jgi:8-oxo-dGTP diphosphatase
MNNIAKATSTLPQASRNLMHRIAVLVFVQNSSGEHLLLLRAKAPNLGTWSPIGGKLETSTGESPFECAVRETQEETGHSITAADLHLFAMIAEKAYEGACHWLLFLFRCTRPLDVLPADMEEGRFGFFSREAIEHLTLPETDRAALWAIYDRYHDRFVTLRADCAPGHPLAIVIEQITPPVAEPHGE